MARSRGTRQLYGAEADRSSRRVVGILRFVIGDAPQPPGDGGDEDSDEESVDHDSQDRDHVGRPAASERTWIHPAELPGRAALTPAPAPPRRWFIATAGVAASVLLIAGISLLVATPPTPATNPVLTAALRAVPKSVAPSANALNAVSASTSGGAVEATGEGIALVDTKTLTTTMAFVPGSTIRATTANGHQVTATNVATDPVTGMTVATFPEPVTTTTARPAAPVAGADLTALAIPQGAANDTRTWQAAHLEAAATLVEVSSTTLGTIHDRSSLSSTATSLLVAGDGAVVGISDPALGEGTYLPAEMAVELSRSLAHSSTMTHGKLGITGADDHGQGAQVVAVETTGPSAGALQHGDVITAVDSKPVACAADLVDSVWARTAGQQVDLTVDRHGQTTHESVTLAAAP